MVVEPRDVETAVLVRMYQMGQVGNGYRSRQMVERSVGWDRLASHYRARRKFTALAKRLVRKGLLDDHGKSMQVLSLTMRGAAHVRMYLKDNPGAPDSLACILEGRAGPSCEAGT